MSCCDGSQIILWNTLNNVPAVVTVKSIDLQDGYLKTADSADGADLTAGTVIPLNSKVTWYAWSSDGSKGSAQATVTINVLYGDENETVTLEYYFEPSTHGGKCPCYISSYSLNSESAHFELSGVDSFANAEGPSSVTYELGWIANAPPPPAPTFEEWTASAPQAGPWQVGTQVRYGIYFAQGGYTLYGSPTWGDWLTVEDGAFPTMGNLYQDPTGTATDRWITREFINQGMSYLADLGVNNNVTTYTDTNT